MKLFLNAIDERVLGCDGAMGPMLYSKGVFVNQCFDALNLAESGPVAEVHGEYVRAGAEFAVTRPVFDLKIFERFFKRIESARPPLILGLWPFESVLNAEFMANEVPSVRVPDPVLERMRRVHSPEAARAEGVAIAREVGFAFKSFVHAAHVAAPSGRIETAVEVLAGLR